MQTLSLVLRHKLDYRVSAAPGPDKAETLVTQCVLTLTTDAATQRPLTQASVHYGKLSVTRRTFMLVAKISTFVETFDLFDQFERVLDMNFTQFSSMKASRAIRKYYKRSLDNMQVVSVLFLIVQWRNCR